MASANVNWLICRIRPSAFWCEIKGLIQLLGPRHFKIHADPLSYFLPSHFLLRYIVFFLRVSAKPIPKIDLLGQDIIFLQKRELRISHWLAYWCSTLISAGLLQRHTFNLTVIFAYLASKAIIFKFENSTFIHLLWVWIRSWTIPILYWIQIGVSRRLVCTCREIAVHEHWGEDVVTQLILVSGVVCLVDKVVLITGRWLGLLVLKVCYDDLRYDWRREGFLHLLAVFIEVLDPIPSMHVRGAVFLDGVVMVCIPYCLWAIILVARVKLTILEFHRFNQTK